MNLKSKIRKNFVWGNMKIWLERLGIPGTLIPHPVPVNQNHTKTTKTVKTWTRKGHDLYITN